MKTLKEDINEYEEDNERIRVYLKIKPSNPSDKIFYNVSKDKKILSLLDNITLDDDKKSKKIEIDKIFTHKDENSYIYEEVILNCIKNSLNGENFTFISYGDSNSEKHQLIIGRPDSYENINNRGIFPRLLDNYINKIDSNEILSDTISLNLSYVMINNNNLIDLTQLMGIENKILEKITKDELIRKYSKEIIFDKNNLNFLKNIKKTPVESAKDSLFFLLQTLNLLYKLEESSNHFLTWSYFLIIIYVTDNNGKTISTLNFIILPGNEILLHKFARRKSFLGVEKKDAISMALKNNANEFYYSIEDILAYLDIKSLNSDNEKEKEKENNNTYKNNEENKNIKKEKNKKYDIKSKLFHIIGNLSFDINDKNAQYYRRYIIIGSFFANSGNITYIKDTLYFLSQCKKFSGQKISNKGHANFDSTFFNEKIKAKNDQIYDLESKLKTQETKVNELNLLMESKEANLKALQDNYKEQIKSLKDELGFKGDINNLLKENKNSEEYEYTLRVRSTTENNKLKNLKIEELKQQINKIEEVIKQLRTLSDIKENDATMLDIVRSVREAKTKKRKEMELKNFTGQKIEDLKKKNKTLENRIIGYKNEISLKKKIINELPEIFGKNMSVKKNMNNFDIKLNDKDNSLWFINNNKEEVNRIKTEENKERKIIIDKYENILEQNKNSIKNIGNILNNIVTDFQNEKKGYLDELFLLYKCIINIIINYKKVFLSNSSIFVNKEKFDKILNKEEKDINPITFPLLYNELGKIGYGHFQLNNKKILPKKKIIKSKYYKNIVEDEDIKIDQEKDNINSKNKFNYMKKSQRDKKIYKIMDIVKNEIKNDESMDKIILPLNNEVIDKKNKIFSGIQRKADNQLINMTKSDLAYYCTTNISKIEEIENFINNYFKEKGKFDKFDPAKIKIDEIKKKLKIINNNIQELSNKYKNNNIKFENGDKIIQQLRNENHLLRKKIYDNDMRNLYSNFSPSSINNTRKINLSYKKNAKLKQPNIYNTYYNSILTTTSSNGGYNQLVVPNSTRVFSDLYSTDGNKEKMFDLTDNTIFYNNIENYKKRPISSISKINPYFLVAENL